MPDPLHPIAWNRYAYAYNSPLVYTDPSGRVAWVPSCQPAHHRHQRHYPHPGVPVQRRRRAGRADGGRVETTFVQDVGGPLSHILAETSGGSTEWHVYGVAGVLAWTESDAWVYPLKDALGSPALSKVEGVWQLADDGQSTVYLHGHDGPAGPLLLLFRQPACPWSALGVQYGWLE